ncbi:C39 family peptidase [Nonomuraea sp. CA-143628]|uniref:C39 family peptidase n=1 Tax=Nonomuraea sp. CA-143628 TaxID=3239997 RepID=UPI003D89BFA5
MKKCKTGFGIALTTAATVGALQLTALTPAYASPTTPATPTPSPSPTASAKPMGIFTPLSYTLPLKGQRQQTNYYCVPASSSMSLSSFGVNVSQATLAKKMKTTTSGTKGANAVPVINAYVKSRGYKYTIPTDADGNPSVLMSRVSQNIGDLRRAPVIAVWMEQLPWNKGKVKGTKIGHAIVAYGYNKTKGTITVYDPWKPTGGSHTLSASTLAKVIQPGGNMYYVSKL